MQPVSSVCCNVWYARCVPHKSCTIAKVAGACKTANSRCVCVQCQCSMLIEPCIIRTFLTNIVWYGNVLCYLFYMHNVTDLDLVYWHAERACVSPSLSSLILRLLLVFGRRFPKGIVSLLDAIARPYRQIGWIMAGCQQCGWYITTLIGIIYVFCAEECKIVKQRQRDGIVLLLLLLLLPNT